MDKPVTITCEAYDVESITFTCGMQSVEDLNVFVRVEQQVRSNGQSESVKVFEASVNVSKEKVENYEAGEEYSCQCFAHYRVSATGEYKVLNSTKAAVKIAYLNEEFEKEPEGHIVTEGGFLTIFCKPPQGNPEPKVSWLKDGENFDAVNIVQNNLLVFTETELEHTGEYICVAENVAGKRQSSPIMIEVKGGKGGGGDSDDGDNEFGVGKESEEEQGTAVAEETESEHTDDETQIKLDVLKTEKQEEEHTVEISLAKNVSRQSEENDKDYLEKNQLSVLVDDTDSDYKDEYHDGDNHVNIGERQKTDASKCEQMLSHCIAILPDSTYGPETCLALPQHISCIESYISKCREMVDEDTLNAAKLDYEDIRVKCALQPKCPQLDKCRRISAARASNHLTVAQFCQEDNLLQCVDHAVATCNATLSPEEEKIKSNLYKVVDWLVDFCERLVVSDGSLASCDEMMVCDLHIEQMSTDNTTSWCKLISSLVECTNSAVKKCQLNELRNDIEELYSDARHIVCSE
ncbi:unnamed protein product, partial [Candidula unifasciata]